jgi:DNA repair protein RadC
MAHFNIERVRTLYLDSKIMLIRDEVASEASVNQAAIDTREVVRRAMDLGAAVITFVPQPPERRQRATPSGYRYDSQYH